MLITFFNERGEDIQINQWQGLEIQRLVFLLQTNSAIETQAKPLLLFYNASNENVSFIVPEVRNVQFWSKQLDTACEIIGEMVTEPSDNAILLKSRSLVMLEHA